MKVVEKQLGPGNLTTSVYADDKNGDIRPLQELLQKGVEAFGNAGALGHLLTPSDNTPTRIERHGTTPFVWFPNHGWDTIRPLAEEAGIPINVSVERR